MIHTEGKLFQYKTCNKSFNQRANLRRHEKQYAGIREFQCKLCNKDFFVKSHLTRHEKSMHDKEKLFKCHVTHVKKFSSWKCSLRYHEKTHYKAEGL